MVADETRHLLQALNLSCDVSMLLTAFFVSLISEQIKTLTVICFVH